MTTRPLASLVGLHAWLELQPPLPDLYLFPHVAAYPPRAGWLHEIKHDGFCIIARKSGSRVRLYSRPGNDFTHRFPLIVDALAHLRSRSCIIDGESVACDDNGVASFDLIRHHRANDRAFLYAFDLISIRLRPHRTKWRRPAS